MVKELNLYDYFIFPNREEREKIYAEFPKINNISLEISGIEKNSIGCVKAYTWIMEFNNNIASYRIPLLMIYNYYKKEIPEYATEIFNKNTRYSDEKFIYKHYFDYFSEIFLYKIETCFESIYQIINGVYYFGVNHDDSSFIRKVKSMVIRDFPDIYKHVRVLDNNDTYQKMKKLRNLLAHSHSPFDEISVEYKHTNNVYTFGNTKPISSTEMIEFINNILEVLDNFKDNIKKEIENNKELIDNINNDF